MNTDRINRRDLIIETAAELFMEHGYNATSVRQIAEAVGVTEAALYYHFKSGKRELLEAVFEWQMPDYVAMLDICANVNSLKELVACMGQRMKGIARANMQAFRWIAAEFPHLTDEEKDLFYTKHLHLQKLLAEYVGRFVDDPIKARHLALTFICIMIGYGQLFWNMDMESLTDFHVEDLIETVVDLLDKPLTSAE